MNDQKHHNTSLQARLAAPVLLLTFALTACGGASEQNGATDLYGAYDVIDKGMSVAQLKAVIGAEPLRNQPDGEKARLLTWETDANTYRHVTLLVAVENQEVGEDAGVSRKIITGYRGNKSQSF